MILKKKQQKKTYDYDKENMRPILRCSICTGEQVAGFRNIHTGKFEEITVIRNEQELEAFMKTYDISAITKEY